MSKSSQQTASFLVRFTQHITNDASGDTSVHWRGKITHVQGDQQQNFVEFSDAIDFMQEILSGMTIAATEDRSPEEQEGLLHKSFEIWKKVAKSGPKIVMDAIKDPKKQVAQLQDQISQVGDELGQRIEIDKYRAATRSDFKAILDRIDTMNEQILSLAAKVESLQPRRN